MNKQVDALLTYVRELRVKTDENKRTIRLRIRGF